MLVGLIVAIVLMLLVMAMAAPKIAQDLRREKELEAARRGDQYTRAIRLYYRKFGHYPGSMEQLEKSNNIRYLRQRYLDPVTGKDDWRLIPVGQNKTTVKGFFGQPLAGLPGAGAGGLGSAAGMASSGLGAAAPTGSPVTTPGGGGGLGAAAGAAGAGSTGTDAYGAGAAGSGSGTGGSGTGGLGSASGMVSTSFGGASGGAPFMGVGLKYVGDSVLTLNEQTSYETWEFIYDPRIEALKGKTSLLGGAPAAAPGGLGQPGSGTNGIPGFNGTQGSGAPPNGGAQGIGAPGGGTTGGTTTPPQP
jgi:type II secretory pathway pseudopilin PulG